MTRVFGEPQDPSEPRYKLTPIETSLDSQQLEISIGPQHPSTPGVFRMDVPLDGELVTKLKPALGYLHRNHDQTAERTTYLGTMPFTDRLDYVSSRMMTRRYSARFGTVMPASFSTVSA